MIHYDIGTSPLLRVILLKNAHSVSYCPRCEILKRGFLILFRTCRNALLHVFDHPVFFVGSNVVALNLLEQRKGPDPS